MKQKDALYGSTAMAVRAVHMCPPCTYKLQEDTPMEHSVLLAMDGNSSLKRVLRTRESAAGDGELISIARPDNRNRISELFIEAAEVDVYKDEVKRKPESKVSTWHFKSVRNAHQYC